MKSTKTIVLLAVLSLLTACFDDGDDGTNGSNGIDGINGLVKQTMLAAGHEACFNGGVQVDSGLDSNSNGQLDVAEITATEFVCTPAIPAQLTISAGEKNGVFYR